MKVWVGDPDVLRRVYNVPECCGRPASFKDPGGTTRLTLLVE